MNACRAPLRALVCALCVAAAFCMAGGLRAAEPDLAAVSLPVLAARLADRYRAVRPAQWGAALPGTLVRLPASGGAGHGDVSAQREGRAMKNGGPADRRPASAAPSNAANAPTTRNATAGATVATPSATPPVAPPVAPVVAPVVSLTLDACGGGFDVSIITLLRELRVPATLFLAGPWLDAHPAEAAALAADPLFEIANHGARHRPASVTGRTAYGIRGTRSVAELVEEVEPNARRLAALVGARPRFYRAATLYCDEVAVRVVADLGQTVAGCSVAADAGATLPVQAVARNLLAVRHGDIVLLHMNKPASGTGAGLRAALPELVRRGVRFVRLSEALGLPAGPGQEAAPR